MASGLDAGSSGAVAERRVAGASLTRPMVPDSLGC